MDSALRSTQAANDLRNYLEDYKTACDVESFNKLYFEKYKNGLTVFEISEIVEIFCQHGIRKWEGPLTPKMEAEFRSIAYFAKAELIRFRMDVLKSDGNVLASSIGFSQPEQENSQFSCSGLNSQLSDPQMPGSILYEKIRKGGVSAQPNLLNKTFIRAEHPFLPAFDPAILFFFEYHLLSFDSCKQRGETRIWRLNLWKKAVAYGLGYGWSWHLGISGNDARSCPEYVAIDLMFAELQRRIDQKFPAHKLKTEEKINNLIVGITTILNLEPSDTATLVEYVKDFQLLVLAEVMFDCDHFTPEQVDKCIELCGIDPLVFEGWDNMDFLVRDVFKDHHIDGQRTQVPKKSRANTVITSAYILPTLANIREELGMFESNAVHNCLDNFSLYILPYYLVKAYEDYRRDIEKRKITAFKKVKTVHSLPSANGWIVAAGRDASTWFQYLLGDKILPLCVVSIADIPIIISVGRWNFSQAATLTGGISNGKSRTLQMACDWAMSTMIPFKPGWEPQMHLKALMGKPALQQKMSIVYNHYLMSDCSVLERGNPAVAAFNALLGNPYKENAPGGVGGIQYRVYPRSVGDARVSHFVSGKIVQWDLMNNENSFECDAVFEFLQAGFGRCAAAAQTMVNSSFKLDCAWEPYFSKVKGYERRRQDFTFVELSGPQRKNPPRESVGFTNVTQLTSIFWNFFQKTLYLPFLSCRHMKFGATGYETAENADLYFLNANGWLFTAATGHHPASENYNKNYKPLFECVGPILRKLLLQSLDDVCKEDLNLMAVTMQFPTMEGILKMVKAKTINFELLNNPDKDWADFKIIDLGFELKTCMIPKAQALQIVLNYYQLTAGNCLRSDSNHERKTTNPMALLRDIHFDRDLLLSTTTTYRPVTSENERALDWSVQSGPHNRGFEEEIEEPVTYEEGHHDFDDMVEGIVEPSTRIHLTAPNWQRMGLMHLPESSVIRPSSRIRMNQMATLTRQIAADEARQERPSNDDSD